MNIVSNERIIRRNARIGQVAMVAGLVVLAGGMYISFQSQEQFGLSLAALLVGFTLSQIGIYFSNRWSRRPRPDEHLNQALKGLDSRYTLYHYTTPASHLLVGPAGIWVFDPRHQRGKITYDKGRWRQKGGGLMMAYLKIFAQEGLGRPDLEMSGEVESVEKYLKTEIGEEEAPQVESALVFTNEETEIEIEDDATPPAPTLHASQLKDFIRKEAKNKPISMDDVKKIQRLFSDQEESESDS
jgi:hypothetical protein